MADTPALDVTALLQAWTGGDLGAQEKLAPILWKELRQNARAYMRQERAGHTLQPAALVNEAFLKLVDLRRALGVSSQTVLRDWSLAKPADE
jgi:hypothetical protein